MSASAPLVFTGLGAVADHLREDLESKKFVLLYGHNGAGKTRLSGAFKSIGKHVDIDGETTQRDTLYFNAFTQDLFTWHNDLDSDSERYLVLHPTSTFFAGLEGLEMENRILPLLRDYADFDFRLDKIPLKNGNGDVIGEQFIVRFSRNVRLASGNITVENIKISRGEENIFIWCFFLAIVEIAIAGDESNPYDWVRYIYIDDPISSLDEHNAVQVAYELHELLADSDDRLKVVISTHDVLFYNVLANQLRKKALRYFLARDDDPDSYVLERIGSVPPFYHLSTLIELSRVQITGELNIHHFHMLRRVLEQTAGFFGYEAWHECLKPKAGESDKAYQKRILDLMSHADYAIFEGAKITEKQRSEFQEILDAFRRNFPFNPALFTPKSGNDS